MKPRLSDLGGHPALCKPARDWPKAEPRVRKSVKAENPCTNVRTYAYHAQLGALNQRSLEQLLGCPSYGNQYIQYSK